MGDRAHGTEMLMFRSTWELGDMASPASVYRCATLLPASERVRSRILVLAEMGIFGDLKMKSEQLVQDQQHSWEAKSRMKYIRIR